MVDFGVDAQISIDQNSDPATLQQGILFSTIEALKKPPVVHKNAKVIRAEDVAFRVVQNKKHLKIPKFGESDYAHENVEKRRKWVEETVGVNLKHLSGQPVLPQQWKGNIENLIGVAQIPVGITGPILVHGQHAEGSFFVPMATTEGAIVTVYNLGMRIVSESGGVKVRVKSNYLHVSPVFITETIEESEVIVDWVKLHYKKIREIAESTTRHGKLLEIKPQLIERGLLLQFIYSTGDAQGMNMINVATHKACQFIEEAVKKHFYERSNYSAVKKISNHVTNSTFGKSVFCESVVTREVLKKLRVSPEDMQKLWHRGYLSSMRANMLGINCQAANGMAAIFLACGQDMADISSSHVATSNCEVNGDGDLYVSLHIPSLLVGTVGGGTGNGTQKECLSIMECAGSGMVDKFSEIIGATLLAGEITTGAALVTGNFVRGHAALGRNKPE